jgi:hypothetical protein
VGFDPELLYQILPRRFEHGDQSPTSLQHFEGSHVGFAADRISHRIEPTNDALELLFLVVDDRVGT